MITREQASKNTKECRDRKQDKFSRSASEYLESEEFKTACKLIENTSLDGDSSCVIEVSKENVPFAVTLLLNVEFDVMWVGEGCIRVDW